MNQYMNTQTLVTPNAIVHHANFKDIQIKLNPGATLDLMDIKEIYAAFFRQYLQSQIEVMQPDALINLGYRIAKEQPIAPL